MQKRILPLAITALLISLIGWNCTKLDTTDIGSDLLPAVDNVHTFDTTLLINTTQGFFNDSTTIGKYDDHAVGSITNDPLFGRTTANIYMQLKPPFYPYYFGNPNDTLVAFDSVVLCLKYAGFWGDSLLPVGLEVREVSDNLFRDRGDSIFTTAYKPNVSGTILGSTNVDARKMTDTIRLNNGRDKVVNQIRIKLSAPWVADLFNRDSIKANSVNNAFFNDSIYRRFYNGIAVVATGTGNGLLYASLSDTATKLEVHYKRKNGNGGKIDSVYSSFRLNPVYGTSPANAPVSATSNYILRTRAGFPVSNPVSTEHYLQTAPGTFVNLSIPGLAGLSNRVVHRAEIIIEQIPTDPILDEKFSAPNFLYLDLKDTGTTNKWKPLYFDLNTSEVYSPDNIFSYMPSQIDYQYYGGFRRSKTDPLTGGLHKYYNFNISRYVQRIVTQHTHVYDMRLYAPFNLNYPQYSNAFIPYGNNIAFGRVRIGSGSNPNYRLRLRIVYSKL